VADVKVTHAWIRLAPPSASVHAAYMQLLNQHQRLHTIVQVKADCCLMAMLHETLQRQDRVFMDHLSQLDLPAGKHVELMPGGIHIMLMKPYAPLLLNDVVTITLVFKDKTQQTITAVVAESGYGDEAI